MSADTIVRVDPTTLQVGPNVRQEVDLSASFVASVKDLGVRIPITAYENPLGELVVVDGQRRTLAAVDAGVTSVPVFVTARPSEQERLVDQVVVNEHRTDLTEKDATKAVQQLSLFDMTVPAIATKLGLKEKFVGRAVKIASSAAAAALLDSDTSLDDLALLAEFDDHPKHAELAKLAAAGGWQFRERAQQLRDERELATATEAIKALEGVTLIEAPGYSDWDPMKVSELFQDKESKKPLDKLGDKRLRELAGDGLCAYVALEWEDGVRRGVVRYAIKGWEARGLFTYSYRSKSSSSKPSTPEDAEKLKLERRAARESTKEWVAATALRVAFLQDLVKRKTMPKGWEPLVIARLLSHESVAAGAWRIALAILGLSEGQSHSLRGNVEEALKKSPTRALQIGLAAWASAIEGSYDFDRKGWQDTAKAKPYLLQLEAWGYELTQVELVAAGKKRAVKP